jgi:phage tail sheath protein FI
LSARQQWRYVSTRRVLLTAERWIQISLTNVAFEPITPSLWGRIERDLYLYFLDEFRRGALVGEAPEEAFFVRCNEETNPREVRENGEVIAHIGLALSTPFEFVVVRLIHGATGVRIAGQIQPWESKRGE